MSFVQKKEIHILKCFLRWPVRTKHGQKTYNANLKQVHIIRNTNAKLYNTNTTFKWNQKYLFVLLVLNVVLCGTGDNLAPPVGHSVCRTTPGVM